MEILIGIKDELSDDYHNSLLRCIDKCRSLPETYLFSACEKHIEEVKKEYEKNIIVDYESAKKLFDAFQIIRDSWKDFNDDSETILKAAMYYYALDEDEESDTESFLGFDDDVAIANACFNAVGRSDLVIDLTIR